MTSSARQTLHLDTDWKFHLGDIPSPIPNTHIAAYMANKAGWSRGPAKGDFDDSDWRMLDLPHDWSVEGKFDPENHVDAGFLPRGIGWYRRHFRLEESDRNKHLSLQFDGVATHCTVYVNGHLLHRNFCGYIPFTIDITDIANFGDQLNVIAVKVDATYMEGWWYEGAGIYRHVWLQKTHKLHIAPNGIFVHPQKQTAPSWMTNIDLTITNSSDFETEFQITTKIIEPPTTLVSEACPELVEWVLPRPGSERQAITQIKIPPHSTITFTQQIPIDSPKLWSLEHRNLYHLQTQLKINKQTIDETTTPFAYRTIHFDPNLGFFLNDQPLKLKGTCNHQDHAGLGVAVPESIHKFRIQRLLDMGSNAYRCAHNPPAPELLDACDQLGMLVIDETRNFGSSPEKLQQLESMILRDRNHPSIILWSICNEEAVQGTNIGANIARAMQQAVKVLDPTRPVTAAVSGGMLNDNSIGDVIEVMGINYQLATYQPYHAKHPQTPLLASETHCAMTTRDIYKTNPTQQIFNSYDEEKASWGTTARQAWGAISKQPFVAGLFAWTGFDYRGEPSPHHWPSVTSHWGILDTCGFPKDSFHLHKAFFTKEPFIHILPHWNWPGQENQPIRVAIYTNCPTIELFLNEKSLGRKSVDPIDMIEWTVPYHSGQLRAVAYDGDTIITEQSITTTGPATSIGLEIHPSFNAKSIPADGEFALPITAYAADAAGHRIPTADNFLTFTLTGPATILGVGNGNPNSHEPDKASARSLFNGLAQIILQTTTTPGNIKLKASAPGLAPATLELESVQSPIRPTVPPAQIRYLIHDWLMSCITPDRPDPNQPIAEQDMNTWERINPANGPQQKWQQSKGYAIYRATIKIPKTLQRSGGRLIFHQIAGTAEIYVNGIETSQNKSTQPDRLEVPIPPTTEKLTASILLRADQFPAGITAPVELLP